MIGIYCKAEGPNSPWQYIPATLEAMSAVVKRGAMYATWNEFEFQPGNGQGEPIRSGWMPFDFDDKENPQNALNDMRALCLVHLPEIYD